MVPRQASASPKSGGNGSLMGAIPSDGGYLTYLSRDIDSFQENEGVEWNATRSELQYEMREAQVGVKTTVLNGIVPVKLLLRQRCWQ